MLALALQKKKLTSRSRIDDEKNVLHLLQDVAGECFRDGTFTPSILLHRHRATTCIQGVVALQQGFGIENRFRTYSSNPESKENRRIQTLKLMV